MQRPWRNATYWLASPGLLSLLSYRTQDYQPRAGTTHKGPFQRKCLTAGSHGGFSSREAPFIVKNTACVKLTHKTSQYRPSLRASSLFSREKFKALFNTHIVSMNLFAYVYNLGINLLHPPNDTAVSVHHKSHMKFTDCEVHFLFSYRKLICCSSDHINNFNPEV
jgi:hypothetical protein